MMTVEQVRALDKTSNPTKLLPSTIYFLKEMREVTNAGRARRDEPVITWNESDELRY